MNLVQEVWKVFSAVFIDVEVVNLVLREPEFASSGYSYCLLGKAVVWKSS